MLWKEREKRRINTGEMKVTDGGRERDRKRGTGQKRDRNKGKLKHSHIRGEREREKGGGGGRFISRMAGVSMETERGSDVLRSGWYRRGRSPPLPPLIESKSQRMQRTDL